MIEDTRRRSRGPLETFTVTENWSDGSNPSIVEIVCFMESFAESETPLEITTVSRGSIRLSILAITENPRSKLDLRVETNSSETPPPSTPEIRQETLAGDLAKRCLCKEGVKRWCRENSAGGGAGGGGCGGWRGLRDRSVKRERTKARAVAAMEEDRAKRKSSLSLSPLSLSKTLSLFVCHRFCHFKAARPHGFGEPLSYPLLTGPTKFCFFV